MKITNEIKRILAFQARSLLKARGSINNSFKLAVEAIFRCPGKIVVTGIGKSGLVAQKVASTLTSTGTPAIYLHPIEGLHGNLGVIQKSDIVLAIGKSGESEELLSLLPAIRKIGAKVISLTATRDSSLAQQSSIVLHVPLKKEACPLNLAPTTSSTLALVVGDAIALTLMKMRGFDADSFALYHPGGLLGKKLLLKVSDIMRSGKRNPVVSLHASMDQLLVEITQKWTGAASIVDHKGHLVGLVTDYDIRNAFAKGELISSLKIKDIMNPHPTAVFSDDTVMKALQTMERRPKPLTVLPVIDRKKRAVGMLHLHDFVQKGLVSNASQQ
ncbi:MAG: KpsF/GutQ family sugar-phosphate isomerase [Elusimicrobia bacterium]|nr:KpsF/GutQ family sugar-phosphate isomerase [Candidatus Obscuribacterium magneticum]